MSAPMALPYAGAEVPHVLLDILRGCNMRCRACYNSGPAHLKPMAEVMGEFQLARRLRRLDWVTLIGGEPLLHPELFSMARAIRDQGIRVAVFTNALALDQPVAHRLKTAGVKLVIMHIEEQQERPDLADARPETLRRLRQDKLALLAEAGIEGGLSITAMPGREHEIDEAVGFALGSPDLSYCLVTLCLDTKQLPALAGDITIGMRALSPGPIGTSSLQAETMVQAAARNLGPPFLVHDSIAGDPRWFAYLVSTVHQSGHLVHMRPLRPTWIERAANRIGRWVRGRHAYFQLQRPGLHYVHLILNALAGGGFWRTLRVLTQALRPRATLRMKRLLFQIPASLDANGQVVFCRDCPDSVIRDGKLVPVCVSDRVVTPRAS